MKKSNKRKSQTELTKTKKPFFKLNALTVTLAVVASIIIFFIAYIPFVWLIEFFITQAFKHERLLTEDVAVAIVFTAIFFGTGLISAVIVLMVLKNRRN